MMYVTFLILALFLLITIVYYKKNTDSIDFSNAPSYIFIVFLLLLFFTVFRSPGGLSEDYTTYQEIFRLSSKPLSFLMSNFPQNDIGFLVINKFFRLFTDNFLIFLFFIHTVIIGCFFYFFKKNSKSVWVSILLLLTVGGYYISFNLIRQFFAISLLLLISDFLYERKTLKYCVCVLLISLIHKSSLLMIPFYFISNINWLTKKRMMCLLLFTVFIFLNFDFILSLAQNIIYGNYNSKSFGMHNASLKNFIRPLLIIFFILINYKNINLNNEENIININSTIVGFVIMIFSMRLEILTRFYYYFLPYSLVLISNIIPSRVKIKNNPKNKYILIVMATLLLVYILLTQLSVNYQFIWDLGVYLYG